MNRREFLKTVSFGAAAIAIPDFLKQADAFDGDKPNIIVILADDLGYGDLGCYRSEVHKTPNIDALAQGGLKFTDFHSNGAMCSPTRAALLTGMYQQRAGIQNVLSSKGTPDLGLAQLEVTFAEVLKSAGYTTAMFGKWHLGIKPEFNPVKQGFDEFIGFVTGDSDYHSHIDRSGKPDWWKNDKLVPEDGYTTDLLSDHACKFIEANKDKTFCVYLPYQAVHFPFQGPKDHAYRVVGSDYWTNTKYGSRYEPVEDRKLAYKEMVESMDAGIGRLVETVRRVGVEKKTVIFVTSDNGAYSWVGSNAPLAGQKGGLLEGGHRVPAVAYWPGKIKAGAVADETVLTMDLFPTMAAIAGAMVPNGLKLDGTDISDVLFRGRKLPERTVFWRTNGEGAVRKGQWKLLLDNKDKNGSGKLFNLADDIGEKNNLAGTEPEIVKSLRSEFDAWEKDVARKPS